MEFESEKYSRFWECLAPDTGAAGRRYVSLHRKLIGYFSTKGVSDPAAAADETLDRAAGKINDGANVPDVDSFCFGIARNIARERWRREQRESSVFQLFINNLEDNSDEEIERIQRLLKPCFEGLSPGEQELLMAYCQVLRGRARAEHRRQLAEARQTTVQALRMIVTRLRSTLKDCVKKGEARA